MTRCSGAPGGGAGNVRVARVGILLANARNCTRRGSHFCCPSLLKSTFPLAFNDRKTAILYNLVPISMAATFAGMEGR